MTSPNHLQSIWRQKWIVMIVSVAVAVSVWAVRKSATPTYRATSLLTVTPAAELSGGTITPEATAFLARSYASRVVTAPVLGDATRNLGPSLTVSEARRRITVRTSPQSGDIQVNSTASSARDAVALNRAVVDSLASHVAADQAAERQQSVAPLDAQVASAQATLASAPAGSPAAAAALSTYTALLDARAARQARPDDRLDVIDQASLPLSPVAPKPARDAVFGLIVALVVTSELAVFLPSLTEARRHRAQGEDDGARLAVPARPEADADVMSTAAIGVDDDVTQRSESHAKSGVSAVNG
jgi:capsular polysaccharide biosynthesis protein